MWKTEVAQALTGHTVTNYHHNQQQRNTAYMLTNGALWRVLIQIVMLQFMGTSEI